MTDFRETKIKILSEEHSRTFQEAVFEAGGSWYDRPHTVQYLDFTFLYVDSQLRMSFLPENANYFNRHPATEIFFNLPTKGHPHAELMMQLAEDAKTHTEPWKLYQIKTVQGIWKDIGHQFIFDKNCTYRRKPKTHIVNGVEIPDISFTPAYLQDYWFPNPSTDGFCHQTRYAPMSSGDIHRAKHNLCYLP